jgi:hypothetical protein
MTIWALLITSERESVCHAEPEFASRRTTTEAASRIIFLL